MVSDTSSILHEMILAIIKAGLSLSISVHICICIYIHV